MFNANNYPNLINLLTIPEVCDTIIVTDCDSGDEINITELILRVKEELGL